MTLLLLLLSCQARSLPPPARTERLPLVQPDDGLLFGYWGLNGHHETQSLDRLKQDLGLRVFQVASDDPTAAVSTLLPAARAAGVRVTLRLAGDHPAYSVDGHFDLEAWKRGLSRWEGSGLEPFIEDGTLVGHMLLDDILTFPGRDPTGDELDEMARFSRERFPGLMTFVRAQATHIPRPTGGSFRHLDACVNQYQARDGAVTAYARVEQARAEELDLGIIGGLNIADGGDGRAGRQGWRGEGFHPMSAEEITEYGAVTMAVPGTGMFLNWEYDRLERWPDGTVGAEYFDQPELRAALQALGRQAASTPSAPLRRP